MLVKKSMQPFEEKILSTLSVKKVYRSMQVLYWFTPTSFTGIDSHQKLEYLTQEVFYAYYYPFVIGHVRKRHPNSDEKTMVNRYITKLMPFLNGPFKDAVKEHINHVNDLPEAQGMEHLLRFQDRLVLDPVAISKIYQQNKDISREEESDDFMFLRYSFYHYLYEEYIDQTHDNMDFYELRNESYEKYFIPKSEDALFSFKIEIDEQVLRVHPCFDAIVEQCIAVEKIIKAYRAYKLRTRLPVVANKARLKDMIEYRPLTGIKYVEAKEFFENKEWLQ
jgi:hypothetical protein